MRNIVEPVLLQDEGYAKARNPLWDVAP